MFVHNTRKPSEKNVSPMHPVTSAPSVSASLPCENMTDQTLADTDTASSRHAQLLNWLALHAERFELTMDQLAPASGDASFRRYYRIPSGVHGTLVVMDAPPPHEDCRPFVHVTRLLETTGVSVPELHAYDLEQGFMLLSDLGKYTYYQVVQTQPEDAALQAIYRDTLNALVKLQTSPTQGLPEYDAQRLHQELQVFPEWYVERLLQTTLSPAERSMLGTIFELLVHDAVAQPQVLVHRDFHSPNLILSPADNNPGIIDYQDALKGPISYDIASLVMDARTTWEEDQQLDWAIRYWEAARTAGLPVPNEFAVFHQQYEWMSLQRNLRILGVFARLSLRDQKHHYLDHIPRLLNYVRQVAFRYHALRPLIRLLNRLEELPASTPESR